MEDVTGVEELQDFFAVGDFFPPPPTKRLQNVRDDCPIELSRVRIAFTASAIAQDLRNKGFRHLDNASDEEQHQLFVRLLPIVYERSTPDLVANGSRVVDVTTAPLVLLVPYMPGSPKELERHVREVITDPTRGALTFSGMRSTRYLRIHCAAGVQKHMQRDHGQHLHAYLPEQFALFHVGGDVFQVLPKKTKRCIQDPGWEHWPQFLIPAVEVPPSWTMVTLTEPWRAGMYLQNPTDEDLAMVQANNLEWFGLLPWDGKVKKKPFWMAHPLADVCPLRDHEVIVGITPELLKRQVAYIYANEMTFLTVLHYVHEHNEMLRHGRAKEHIVKSTFDVSANRLVERYALNQRVRKPVLDLFLSQTPLQVYRNLQWIVLAAPPTDTAMVVYRGQDNLYPWDKQPRHSGSVLVSDSILSASLSIEVARKFGDHIIRYLLPRDFPCLFVGLVEQEVVLPEGMVMRWETIDVEYGSHPDDDHTSHRIHTVRVVGLLPRPAPKQMPPADSERRRMLELESVGRYTLGHEIKWQKEAEANRKARLRAKEALTTALVARLEARNSTHYHLGMRLSRGAHAEVYPGCVDREGKRCPVVVRIAPLITGIAIKNFENELAIRKRLQSSEENLDRTEEVTVPLLDAFRVERKGDAPLGVTVFRRASGNLISLIFQDAYATHEAYEVLKKRLLWPEWDRLSQLLGNCRVMHNDLHPANVVWQYNSYYEPVLRLIDFEQAEYSEYMDIESIISINFNMFKNTTERALDIYHRFYVAYRNNNQAEMERVWNNEMDYFMHIRVEDLDKTIAERMRSMRKRKAS